MELLLHVVATIELCCLSDNSGCRFLYFKAYIVSLQIIFTFLETDIDAFCKQFQQKSDKGSRVQPVIQYTKSFDYMDVNERAEVLEFLFWLGYVQSMGYQDI